MSALSTSGNQNVGTLADGIRTLVGQPLASVEFVQDYVQLHFDGPTLTAYTLPTRQLILGSKGGEKIEPSRNVAVERTYRVTK